MQKNSPTILSAIAVVGVAATGYLTFKATWKAREVIDANPYLYEDGPDVLTNRQKTTAEKALLVWKLYIPAAGVGALTIVSIVASNRIAVRRLAALAAAYGVLSGDFDEYRNKALELLGDKKAKSIEDKMAEEKMTRNPPPQAIAPADVNMLESGKGWFQDLSTGQNIIADRQQMEKARNDLNYSLLHDGYADMNQWYSFAGFDSTNLGGQLGWKSEEQIEVVFSPVMLPDGRTATGVKLHPEPSPDFDSLH